MGLFTKSGTQNKLITLKVKDIVKNPEQPRRHFDERELRELAESLISCGMIQPLTVRYKEGRYELVAGERRLRAAAMAGLAEVPCIISGADDEQAAILSLTENIQRKDLNFFEEAAAIAKLISQYGLTQEQAAGRLGRSQPAIANKLRLLTLDEKCIAMILEHQLTERHARALLKIEDPAERLKSVEYIVKHKLNVEQSEQYIQRVLSGRKKPHVHILVRDVRVFINTIDRAIGIVKKSGIETDCIREETAEGLKMTIYIKKKVPERVSMYR